LVVFVKTGYYPVEVQPIDMFPHKNYRAFFEFMFTEACDWCAEKKLTWKMAVKRIPQSNNPILLGHI